MQIYLLAIQKRPISDFFKEKAIIADKEKLIEESIKYHALFSIVKNRIGYPKRKREIAAYSEIIKNFSACLNNSDIPITATIRLYFCRGMYYDILFDYDKSYKNHLKVLEILDKGAVIKAKLNDYYQASLHNVIISLTSARQYKLDFYNGKFLEQLSNT